MGQNSNISWTDHTWNPWQGCRKVSPGCKFCYMYRDKLRYGQDPKTVVRSSAATFNKPKSWKKPVKVFVCSWSDFFIEEADAWRNEAWEIMKANPHLTFQILTKRPERILQNLPIDWGSGYDNVWIGTSIESQEQTPRLAFLADVPAKVRFVSAEPLLGPVDLKPYLHKIQWVIVGGESGAGSKPNDNSVKYGYRECAIGWINDIQLDCYLAKVPVFVKQVGTYLAKLLKKHHGASSNYQDVGKAGQLIDVWNKVLPHAALIQQFPL